jgi:alkylation response protein AidB-like acyl-CoA dehydrogenase
MLDKGLVPNYQASMEKLFGSEMVQRITNKGMEILGPYSQLDGKSATTSLADRVGYYYRWGVVETIWGGTSEIQRNIMALRGLGLPRA